MKVRFKCLGCGKIATLGIGSVFICGCNRQWLNNPEQGLQLKTTWGYTPPIKKVHFKFVKEE